MGRFEGATKLRLSSLRFLKGGNSAETSLADLSFKPGAAVQTRSLIICRQLAESEIFLNADRDVLALTMEALARHPAIPAPRLIGIEHDPAVFGSAFLVMEKGGGQGR